jgi:predicted nucleotidyltransferase|tara:strand:- start:559 stop:1380 length:822 start_codon:yes stop_codon:yes gene_type:complete
MSIEGFSTKTEQNESEKRFTLPKEEFAKERIKAVKESISELKEGNPLILSFCMYGSMVKGTTKPESDIDGFLFVDTGLSVEERQQHDENLTEDKESKSKIETFFIEKINDQYTEKLHETLKSQANLTEEQVAHAKIRPINEEIIDKHIDFIADGLQNEREYKKQYDEWDKNLDSSTTDFNKLDEYLKARPEYPEPVSPSTTLAGMFHFEIGGGIRKYRDMLISKLESMEQDGEKIWQEIIKSTEMFEQNLSSGTEKRYPRTLDEAKKVYGLKK